jgi:hypothetical protein
MPTTALVCLRFRSSVSALSLFFPLSKLFHLYRKFFFHFSILFIYLLCLRLSPGQKQNLSFLSSFLKIRPFTILLFPSHQLFKLNIDLLLYPCSTLQYLHILTACQIHVTCTSYFPLPFRIVHLIPIPKCRLNSPMAFPPVFLSKDCILKK